MLAQNPARIVLRTRREASRSASSRFPLPIVLPNTIAPPYAMPKARTEHSWRRTFTTEFAATMSSPRCPKITEYIEKAEPQTSSLPKAGRENFIKSKVSTLLNFKTFESENFMSF